MEHIAEPLRTLAVPVESLNLDSANARAHDERNVAAIKASLDRFGQRAPIVVQEEGRIVRAGNGRLIAARELGWTHVAAVIVDESSVDATAFALADNRTAELAEWDDDALRATIAALEADGIEPIGWDADEIAAILHDPSFEPVPEEAQAALDSKTPTVCPECGHSWIE